MKRHYLYVTTCKLNGKRYVGQHITRCETVEEMLKDRYLGSGTILISAMKKHGRKQFSKEILCVCDNQEKIDQMEIGFIESHDVLDHPDEWYNRAAGGQYGRGERHSELTSKSMKEIWRRPGYREKMKKIMASDDMMIKKGFRTKKQRQEHKLKGVRYQLLCRVMWIRNLKIKEEQLSIAIENGFESYQQYVNSTTVSTLNDWQRTPIGRFTMSWKKHNNSSSRLDGYGKYTSEQFKQLLYDKKISIRHAASILNCSQHTIQNQRRGWAWNRHRGGKKKMESRVKDSYYKTIEGYGV